MSSWTSLSDDALTVNNVEDTLAPIPDDLWVSAACLDRVLDNIPVQKALLDLGILRTRDAVDRSAKAGDIQEHFRAFPVDKQLCRVRAALLSRLDKLNTFVEISQINNEPVDAWDDDPWVDETAQILPTDTKESPSLSAFLIADILESALSFAFMKSLAALHILMLRHGPRLWPHRFTILAAIPEHVHPSELSSVLPAFDFANDIEQAMTFTVWRPEADWSESSEIAKLLVEEDDLPMSSLSTHAHTELLTTSELVRWYTDRVDSVIHSTGMVDVALATIQHGASQGLPDLDAVGEDLSLLSRLIYDAPSAPDEEYEDDWSLERWHSLEPIDVVRAYVAHSTPETLGKDISRLVMPYLFVLEARAERAGKPDPSLPKRLLYDFVLTSRLEVAAAVFEASKPTLPVAQRLIRDDEDIARLALACLYGSSSLDEWTTMSRIFECLPAWDLHDDDDDQDAADTTMASLGAFVAPSTTSPHCTASDLLVFFAPLPLSSLSRALDILDVHLESGEILSRWSVPAPLRWFLQSNGNVTEQRAWANRMARRAGGSDDKLNTQEDWEWLLEDMLKLSGKGDSGLRGAFGLLTRQEIMCIFLGGLLGSGNFTVATNLIQTSHGKLSLDQETIESVCLASSREFYDNASSGNYKFGEMKLAYECLSVPLPSDVVVKEQEFIEATSRLSSFNVMSGPGNPITPIEIRLTKDRLSLVSRVLSSNSDAYKHTEVILDLVHKLGFRDDPLAEVKALAMVADTALQFEDFTRAFEASQRMVTTVLALRASSSLLPANEKTEEASEVCWVACYQLGRQPEFDDVDKKLSLLSRSLELCPPDKIHDILGAWRRLENDDIENRQARLANRRNGTIPRKRPISTFGKPGSSLRERLQQFHMPSPPLLNTPDAAALASRTFRTVAANFPFSVGRARSQASQHEDSFSNTGSRTGGDGSSDVSAQATRVLSKGIGWLIGDE